jgi:hypothetical protein
MSRSESAAWKFARPEGALVLALLCTSLAVPPVEGQPSPPADAAEAASARLRLTSARELHVGEHARFALEVSLPPGAAEPLLLTPFREGEALEVVKGRLLRSDARDPTARPLQFELPVLARAPGVARIGVRLLAYVCRPGDAAPPKCRALEAETRADVLVLP